MPLFQLNTNAPNTHAYYSLNEFEQGYVEAMFFTNGDTGSENEDLLDELGVLRLTKSAIKSIRKDCNAFMSQMADGCFMRQWLDRYEDYSDTQAGHDFWLTRNGHGAGFWDRKELDKPAQDAFCDAAKAVGEANVEVYKSWIYHR